MKLYHMRWLQAYYIESEPREWSMYQWHHVRDIAVKYLDAHLRANPYIYAPLTKVLSVETIQDCGCPQCARSKGVEPV